MSELPANWRIFYDEELDESTHFNDFGVAFEGGYEGTYYLHRMHHPLAKHELLEQMQAYPWPEYDYANIEHIKEANEHLQAQSIPSVGGADCTIWETSWYIRGMPELMMDMAMEDEKASFN